MLPERASGKGQETAPEGVTSGAYMPEEDTLSDPSGEMHFSLPGRCRRAMASGVWERLRHAPENATRGKRKCFKHPPVPESTHANFRHCQSHQTFLSGAQLARLAPLTDEPLGLSDLSQ